MEPPPDDAPEVDETSGTKAQPRFPSKRPFIDEHRDLPFPEWAAKFLKIRNDDGDIVPFVLNPVQLKIDEEWERQVKERGYVKINILKARKMGASTYTQGKMFRAILESEGWHAGIMAHDDEGCSLIFERVKTFNEHLPKSMRRSIERNNKKEVFFKAPHSAFVRVNVAKAKGAWGSGGDFHLIHFSERAKWPEVKGTSKAQGQAVAIMNAQPKAVIGRAVIDESTARGKGNQYHAAWEGAEPLPGKRWGKNGFVRLFFAWHGFPTYRIPGAKLDDYWCHPDWAKEEEHLRSSYGCDDEQLAWRRQIIAEECEADLDAFHQEYPSCPEEAFLATGMPVFSTYDIQARISQLEVREKHEPIRKYTFDTKGQPEEDRLGELSFYSRHPFYSRDSAMLTEIMNEPDRLVIVADPAGSGANAPNPQKGDPCCAYVWDRKHNEQLAELHGWLTAADFAQYLAWFGALFKNPLLIVEAGPWGGHVISVLERLAYPRLYFRERYGEQLLNAPTNWGQYGWSTTGKSKPQMVEALRELWNRRAIVVNSLKCCKEHLTFVKNGTKREAQSGCHDDTVMVCAMYAAWALEHPYVPPTPWTRAPHTYGDIINEMLAAEGQPGGSGWRLW